MGKGIRVLDVIVRIFSWWEVWGLSCIGLCASFVVWVQAVIAFQLGRYLSEKVIVYGGVAIAFLFGSLFAFIGYKIGKKRRHIE